MGRDAAHQSDHTHIRRAGIPLGRREGPYSRRVCQAPCGDKLVVAAEQEEDRKDWDVVDRRILIHLLTGGHTKVGQDFAIAEDMARV